MLLLLCKYRIWKENFSLSVLNKAENFVHADNTKKANFKTINCE